MFHFLLVLDDDTQRLKISTEQASVIMRRLTNVPTTQYLHGSQARLLTWGIGRHKDKMPALSDGEWALGIGDWSGRTKTPSLRELSTADDTTLTTYDNMFCFLAGTVTEAEAFAMVDPLGRMHVYHVQSHLSSRLISNSAILLAALTNAEWDLESIREFLAKGTVFAQRSLFSNINKLAPNLIYKFSPTQYETRTISARRKEIPNNNPLIISEFEHTLTRALSDILENNHRPLLDITGGFDSRLMLAALMQLKSPEDISTVVVGSDNDRDVLVANMIAREFNLKHTHVRPTNDDELTTTDLDNALVLTDGEYDIVDYAKIMRIHTPLAEEFDISLNGSGGEMIRDEWQHLFVQPVSGKVRPWSSMHLAARRFATDEWGEMMLAHKPNDSLCRHFANIITATVDHLPNATATRLVDEIYLYLRMQRWQGRIASATYGIWPNYSPLLTQKLIDIALQLPPGSRHNSRMPRLLLEYMNPRLARIPMVDGAPATPFSWGEGYRHIPRYYSKFKYYTKKVHGRFFNILKMNNDTSVHGAQPTELFRSLLIPEEMQTSGLYAADALESTVNIFLHGGLNRNHAGRIITLEHAARTLNILRNSEK